MSPDLNLDDDTNSRKKKSTHHNARRTQSMDMSYNHESRSNRHRDRRSGGRSPRGSKHRQPGRRLSMDASVQSIDEGKPLASPDQDLWSSDDDDDDGHMPISAREIADARAKARAAEGRGGSLSRSQHGKERRSHRAAKPGAQSIDASSSHDKRSAKQIMSKQMSARRVAMDGSLRHSNKSGHWDGDSDSEDGSAPLSAREIADARIKARVSEGKHKSRSKRVPGAQAMDHTADQRMRSKEKRSLARGASSRSLSRNAPRRTKSLDLNDNLAPGAQAMDHTADHRMRSKEKRALSRGQSSRSVSRNAPRRTRSLDQDADLSKLSSHESRARARSPKRGGRSHKPGAVPNGTMKASSGKNHAPSSEGELLVEAVTVTADEEEHKVLPVAPPAVQNAAPASGYAELNRTNNNGNQAPPPQANEKPPSKKYKNILILLLVVAGVAAGFFAGGWNKNDSSVVQTNITKDTEIPSSGPTMSASNPPSLAPTLALSGSPSLVPTNEVIVLLFDPPKEEDCVKVRTRIPVQDQENMVTKFFELHLDVILQKEIPESNTWLDPLLDSIEDYLIPALVGCLENNYGWLRRRLQTLDVRFAIGNADATGEVPNDEACEDSVGEAEICHRAVVRLELFLKGDVSIPKLYALLLAVIDSEWGGVVTNRRLAELTLVEKLALPDELVKKVELVKVATLEPTEAPSSAPSSLPSISPSESPSNAPTTSAPTTHPSAVPTMAPNTMPSTEKPTDLPTTRPTKRPTSAPSLRPTSPPTPTPSHLPSSSPSLRPSSSPSELPSVSPSVFPSGAPSLLPSGSPSESPSWIPSMVPSVTPSSAPSGTPSKCDVCIGWEACSSSFDTTGMCNACLGSRACDGAASTISSDSCVGAGACNRVKIGSPIINSCNGENTCNWKFWASLGENSCNCDFCCTCLPHTAVIAANSCNTPGECCTSVGGMSPEKVGLSSCIGEDVCTSQMGDVIGYNSCRGRLACEQQWLDIGNNSCNGDHSCRMANVDISWPHIQTKGTIGNDSCNGSRACYSKQYGFSAGDNSCNGNDACMATWYQQQMYVGNNSCNCDNCCKCFSSPTHIPDNSCNELAPDEASIDFANGAPGEYQYCCTAPAR